MHYRILADALLIAHFVFIIFVVSGGLLVLWNKRWACIHLPAAFWGATIEFTGGICPLTPLENRLRSAGGAAGYKEGFIEHYLIPIIYPPGLTHDIQLILGSLVIGVNLVAYAIVIKQWSARLRHPDVT